MPLSRLLILWAVVFGAAALTLWIAFQFAGSSLALIAVPVVLALALLVRRV